MIYIQLLFLILVANGSPIIGRLLLNEHWERPIDGRALFVDGRPILGASKTFRGVLFSILGASLAAVVLGLPWNIGLVVGVWAMVGDCLSSFVKRRLNMPSSSMALGLDQIPESLLPLLGVWHQLSLTLEGIAGVVAGFFVLELGISAILYKLHIRRHPY